MTDAKIMRKRCDEQILLMTASQTKTTTYDVGLNFVNNFKFNVQSEIRFAAAAVIILPLAKDFPPSDY
jgi:ABC-type glycerol-3-phosphate transport system permease component